MCNATKWIRCLAYFLLSEILDENMQVSYQEQEMVLIDDVEDELAREIGRAVHVTQAYLSTWRPSGTVAHAVNLDVAQNLTEAVFPLATHRGRSYNLL